MCRTYGQEEKSKLDKIITDGAILTQEIEDLKGGLRDAVKAVAEELEIKPAIINKAIRIASKGNWADHNSDFEELEAILDITKKI